MTTRTHGRGRATLAVAMVVFALAGCSTSAKSASPTSNGAAEDRAGGAVPAPLAPADGAKAAAPPTGGPTGAPTVTSRAIIYTGSITIRVDNLLEAATQVSGIAKSVPNGYVSADDRAVNDQQSTAQITIRVPAEDFNDVVNRIANLGKEIDRKISTQDVTASVIDVTSRVKTQQASVDRVRALLAQATSLNEIVSLESELTRREADLESLESQLANLTDLTSLSTITATLLGPATPGTPAPKKDSGFMAGLKSGWHTFVSSVNVLLQIIGALLPFAVVIGLVTWIALRLTRGRRAARAAARAAAYASRPPVAPRVGVPPPAYPAATSPTPAYPPPIAGATPAAESGGRTGTVAAEKEPDPDGS